jgi:alpha-galactosidase
VSVLLPGLLPDRRYEVRGVGPVEPGGPSGAADVTLTGAVLGTVGLRVPALPPESAVVLRCSAVPGG